jgi:hypothetical protein
MGYYMRYFVPPSAQKVTLTAISAMLTARDPLYTIQIDPTDISFGELFYGERNLGEIEINQKDDEIFEEEIEDFLELLGYHTDDQKDAGLAGCSMQWDASSGCRWLLFGRKTHFRDECTPLGTMIIQLCKDAGNYTF